MKIPSCSYLQKLFYQLALLFQNSHAQFGASIIIIIILSLSSYSCYHPEAILEDQYLHSCEICQICPRFSHHLTFL